MRPDLLPRSPELATWRHVVGSLTAGSSRLVMALCAAFAAPLCVMARVRPFCVHLYGEQAEGEDPDGRQLLLRLPGCVYGKGADEWAYWNLLTNGLSRSGVEQNPEDGLLLLSDFDGVPTDSVNEAARRWFDRRGTFPEMAGRRDSVALSCGSKPIDLAAMHLRSDPGGKAWIFNVPTDAGAGDGMFEVATIGSDRIALAAAAVKYGGHVGVHWLDHLNRNGQTIVNRWKAERYFAEVPSDDLATGLSYIELVGAFSRLGAAGEEATRAGLTGWEPGTAEAAVWKCFESMKRAEALRGQATPPA